jgi:hypothetical protein
MFMYLWHNLLYFFIFVHTSLMKTWLRSKHVAEAKLINDFLLLVVQFVGLNICNLVCHSRPLPFLPHVSPIASSAYSWQCLGGGIFFYCRRADFMSVCLTSYSNRQTGCTASFDMNHKVWLLKGYSHLCPVSLQLLTYLLHEAQSFLRS